MRVLITGITGFAGSHLADYLLGERGVELFGTKRASSGTENLKEIRESVRLYDCDLGDPSAVERRLGEVCPDRVFHLAARSSVPESWENPAETLASNILAELHILEAVRRSGARPAIHIAASSEEYGAARPEELPLTERSPLRPTNPYGLSKVAQDLLGYQYHLQYSMHLVRTRAFNHFGPRQKDEFVASNFAKQVAMIEAGRQEAVIDVGDLGSVRDFTDVRDVARAYWLALERGLAGEVYNISSGVGRKIQDVLDFYLSKSATKIQIRKDPRRLRVADAPALVGDCAKFTKQTGWKPLIPFERTLEDTLDFWREKVASDKVTAKN